MKRKNGLSYKTVLLVTILCAFVCILFTGCGTVTVDMNKYMKIVTEGYDSFGTAYYTFDREAFLKDYSSKIKINRDYSSQFEGTLSMGEKPAEIMLDLHTWPQLSKTNGLCNGDYITLSWEGMNEQLEEYFNCKFSYNDMNYEVSGLEKIDTFDPFEYIRVEFSGVSPNGEVNIIPDYNREEMQYLEFGVSQAMNLQLGDTITVTASFRDDIYSFVDKFNILPAQTEKTYTVEGLGRYITEISEIPFDTYEQMDHQLQDTLISSFASYPDETLYNMQLIGSYVFSAKNDAPISKYNYVYFLYKVEAENPESKGVFEYYWYGYYSNVVELEDNTIYIDLSSYTIPDDEEIFKFGGQSYVYYGDKYLESFISQHVAAKLGEYRCVTNVGAEEYTETHEIEENVRYVTDVEEVSSELYKKMDQQLQESLITSYDS